MAELVLGRGKVEVGGTLEMFARLLLGGDGRRKERSEELGRYGDVGELGKEKQSIDVRRLWHINRGEGGCAVEELDSDFWVWRKTELAHEMSHSHAL